MGKPDNINDLEEAGFLLREHMETIRINLEILELMRMQEGVIDTDEQYVEIRRLEQTNRTFFQEFILKELPGLIVIDQHQVDQVIRKAYQDWAADLNLSLAYLDGLIKNYINHIRRTGRIS